MEPFLGQLQFVGKRKNGLAYQRLIFILLNDMPLIRSQHIAPKLFVGNDEYFPSF